MNGILFPTKKLLSLMRPLENWIYRFVILLELNFWTVWDSQSFSHLIERRFRQNFVNSTNPFIRVMFLFPLNRHNFQMFSSLPKQHHSPHNSYKWSKQHKQNYTSLRQNYLLNAILYGDWNFDSDNNESIIAIAIRVYSPQPSNLSDALNISK